MHVAQAPSFAGTPAASGAATPRILRSSMAFCGVLTGISLLASLLVPKGYLLAFIGDVTQVGLITTASCLSLRNARQSHSKVRAFWVLISMGTGMWLGSLILWSVNELWLRRPAPDLPLGDILLFVKLVPLSAAIALGPHKPSHSRFQAFGLLDVCILIVYSLYLYAFWVFAYRLLPGAIDIYNFHFNVADDIGNQIFALVAGIALLRVRGPWRDLYRLYFLAAASYCLASDVSNVAIDQGRYYSGSLFDVPLTLALAALAAFTWQGNKISAHLKGDSSCSASENEHPSRLGFLSSQFAMLVTLSTPAIGLWLLTRSSSPEIFSFRLAITLLTIFVLTLLLSLKQHLLTASLISSLHNLSNTYASINRFRNQLTQNEKLASLGELVAQVANHIKNAMAIILERSQMLTARPDSESRIQSMAGKIGQYAHRTDDLVENMLRFAKETPLQLEPLELKPLIDSTLQLGRTSKLANVQIALKQSDDVPPVLGDSSQLLHVFLQIISNAVDALEEVGGGALDISIDTLGSQVRVEFADSGPGIKEPEHVFEPFYTTKPVGKGTGLGLSTCYGIIHKHEGEISCNNRVEGGAVFIVLLPAAPPAARQALATSSIVREGVR
ncbi:MAG TPA: HAMP domain-containing sensor histidine kinase [Candidatus Acidoferrum sp.]